MGVDGDPQDKDVNGDTASKDSPHTCTGLPVVLCTSSLFGS